MPGGARTGAQVVPCIHPGLEWAAGVPPGVAWFHRGATSQGRGPLPCLLPPATERDWTAGDGQGGSWCPVAALPLS